MSVLTWCSHRDWAGWHTAPACKGEAWREDDDRPRYPQNTENP